MASRLLRKRQRTDLVAPATLVAEPLAVPVMASSIISEVPDIIYQTTMVNGRQNTSSRLILVIRLSDVASEEFRKTHPTSEKFVDDTAALIRPAIHRFDGAPLEIALEFDGIIEMSYLSVSPHMFEYSLNGNTLTVCILRKEIPLSKAFGGAPFVFGFHIISTDEMLVTGKFFSASKEPPAKPPKNAPKRIRGPPPAAPQYLPLDANSSAITDRIKVALGVASAPVAAHVAAAPVAAHVAVADFSPFSSIDFDELPEGLFVGIVSPFLMVSPLSARV